MLSSKQVQMEGCADGLLFSPLVWLAFSNQG
jgi:hypothetical protein